MRGSYVMGGVRYSLDGMEPPEPVPVMQDYNGCDLYEGDVAYEVNGKVYCEDCFEHFALCCRFEVEREDY